MPDPALPIPRSTPLEGTAHLVRLYADPLGRPMRGVVTISGGARSELGSSVVVPAPVTVELVDGVLDVSLPPGDYSIVAMLRTIDGERVSDQDTVTLT